MAVEPGMRVEELDEVLLALPGDVVGPDDLDRSRGGLGHPRVVIEKTDAVGGKARLDFVRSLVVVVAEDREATPGKLAERV